MSRSKDHLGFWKAALLCVTFVTLQLCMLVPFGILDVSFKLHLAAHPAVLGVVNLIACALVLLMGWVIGRSSMREVIALRGVSGLAVVGVIIASAGAIILLSETDNFVRVALPPPEWVSRILRDLAFSSEHVWASVFLLVIVAPLTEELMFRGLILRGFLRRFNVVRAFVLSSILFGATHLNPWQFVSATALGLMFAWWYARAQSLIPSLLGHALVNATVVGHQLLPFKVRGFNVGEPSGSFELQPFWFDALGLLLLAIGLWLFRGATPPIKSPAGPSGAEPSPPDAPVGGVPPVVPPDGTPMFPRSFGGRRPRCFPWMISSISPNSIRGSLC